MHVPFAQKPSPFEGLLLLLFFLERARGGWGSQQHAREWNEYCKLLERFNLFKRNGIQPQAHPTQRLRHTHTDLKMVVWKCYPGVSLFSLGTHWVFIFKIFTVNQSEHGGFRLITLNGYFISICRKSDNRSLTWRTLGLTKTLARKARSFPQAFGW